MAAAADPAGTAGVAGTAGAAGTAPPTAPWVAQLDTATDSAGFRRQARRLLAAGVPPDSVRWALRDDRTPGLFDAPGDAAAAAPAARPARSAAGPSVATAAPHALGAAPDAMAGAAPEAMPGAAPEATPGAPPEAPPEATPDTPDAPEAALRVPASFVALADTVILHRDEGRFALLYRLLWRLRHEPGYWLDTIDADRVRAQTMERAVRRDQHKMKAFVRFRPIDRGAGLPPLHVAWFEPEHHIVEAVAPFFARRFTQMCWTVLTPQRSASWDGRQLVFAGGAERGDAPAADAGEALWLTYYRHIFNPARLKLAMMHKEMPRRYWKNLPEAVLITPLTAAAAERTSRMVAAEPTQPARYAAFAQAAGAARRLGSEPAAAPAGAGLAASLPVLPTDPELPTLPELPTWPELRSAAARCERCPLARGATQTVFGEGPAPARLMFVGEQPGDQEDLRGRPFVGPAGQLFDRALAHIGLARDTVYVTNAVKHFKFEMRGRRRIHKTPAQQELAACLDWLEGEVALVAPQALVALGASAAHALLGRPVAVTLERGRWWWRDDGRPVLVTLHPAALLRLPPEAFDAALQRWFDDLALVLQPPAA